MTTESKVLEYKKILNLNVFALAKPEENFSLNKKDVYIRNLLGHRLTDSELEGAKITNSGCGASKTADSLNESRVRIKEAEGVANKLNSMLREIDSYMQRNQSAHYLDQISDVAGGKAATDSFPTFQQAKPTSDSSKFPVAAADNRYVFDPYYSERKQINGHSTREDAAEVTLNNSFSRHKYVEVPINEQQSNYEGQRGVQFDYNINKTIGNKQLNAESGNIQKSVANNTLKNNLASGSQEVPGEKVVVRKKEPAAQGAEELKKISFAKRRVDGRDESPNSLNSTVQFNYNPDKGDIYAKIPNEARNQTIVFSGYDKPAISKQTLPGTPYYVVNNNFYPPSHVHSHVHSNVQGETAEETNSFTPALQDSSYHIDRPQQNRTPEPRQ